ncbi:hypothetical protein EJ03DRAFT_78982 [Teratosphaeria nubilosa]|uniref:Peptidase A1 domain-containing protein n=1 Tax=Teratosphaeria nubilosa TaxID=161662 RepID=A0A6G1LCK9_9PEZI|nr:hypothetical protein EJ03DRAFT_78982 [Teratosphaeria nubilosa]
MDHLLLLMLVSTGSLTALATAASMPSGIGVHKVPLQNRSLTSNGSPEPLTGKELGKVDNYYFGPASIGKQDGFLFDFDTGSSDVIVEGPSCNDCMGGRSTYRNTGMPVGNMSRIIYMDGSAGYGHNYLDDLTVAGLTAEHQNLISAYKASGLEY